MEITIPSEVLFYKTQSTIPYEVNLCFRHAVQWVISGYDVQTRLVEYPESCDDCLKEREVTD